MIEVQERERAPNPLLRRQRELRGWSQGQVAKELQARFPGIAVTARHVARWESGKRKPGPYYREKLCVLFQTTADKLGFIPQETSEELGLLKTEEEIQDTDREPPTSPSDTGPLQTSYELLAEYIQQQLLRILEAVTPGSAKLRVEDVIGENGLLIPPPWQVQQGIISNLDNLIKYLVEAAMTGQKVLLLGEAGQGKTTVLKHVFVTLANDFLRRNQPLAYLPLYIPLRDFSHLEGSPAEVLWTEIQDHFPLPFEDFAVLLKNDQILFLFDGFDELKGELTQSSINDWSSSKMFARPSILTCRKSFFDFYLSMSPLPGVLSPAHRAKAPRLGRDSSAIY